MPQAQFLGHSCVLLHNGTHRIIIDPFISGSPAAPIEADQVDVQHVLITHGHGDHVGDAISIARRNHATIVANYELSMLCQRQGAQVHPMHIGGAHAFDFGRVKLTIAHHGGGYGDKADIYTGPSVGFLVTIGGKTVYHSGDTGLFYDMKLIGEMNSIDLAFLPIGDNFTMGIDDAVKAVEFLRPKTVVPFHYNTFPVIESSPVEFAVKVGSMSRVVILKPGEHVEF
jgi:L-ascorbate metabolism protein UlaG (beta-lactamase superfamily)